MKIVLNEFDHKILQLLSENSRLSYAELGRKISLSQSATKERVQNLIDIGVIKRCTLDIDYTQLGYSLKVIVHLKFKNDEFRVFIDNIRQFPEIISCKRITGEFCLITECVLKDSAHLENLIDRLIKYGIPSTSVQLSEIKASSIFFNQL